MTDPAVPPRPPLPADPSWAWHAAPDGGYPAPDGGYPAATATYPADAYPTAAHPAAVSGPPQAAPPSPALQPEHGWYAGYGHEVAPPALAAPGYGDPSFAAPYAAPAAPGWAPPAPGPTAVLGAVALALALVAAIVAPVVGGVAGWIVGQGVGAQLAPTEMSAAMFDDLRFLTPVRDAVLVAEIAFWAGTILGVWAIGQGIVAIARRRGRGTGIAAVIVAPLGFVVFVVVTWFVVVFGMIAGAAGAGAAS